jgi:aryl-alcohol dehydrogenase-like predicted oxidoreductase
METRILGRKGLSVSRIGLGMAALGRPGYINLGHTADLEGNYEIASMQRRAEAVLDAAWAAGITYFDAARSYGKAESFLAGWLSSRRIDVNAVVVGSKWGYTYTAGWRVKAEQHEIKDHSLKTLLRQTTESREILGDYLKLYQIHSATLESGVLGDREVLAELARLRASGLKIGLTLTGPRQAATLKQALEVAVDGKRLFDCVQATWNLLAPSAGGALAEARAAGMGVIIKEALANGRLTPRNTDPAFAGKRRMLEDAAVDHEVSTDALSLAAALARPWADVVLYGAATLAQLRSNLAALTVNWRTEDEEGLGSIAEEAAEYWDTRARLAWN